MTHDERVYHHEMETCEGIHQHAERIASLEELVIDMWKVTSRLADVAMEYDHTPSADEVKGALDLLAVTGDLRSRMQMLGMEASL